MDQMLRPSGREKNTSTFCDTKCIICWKTLGLKHHLLCGVSSKRKDIKQKLKDILCLQDYVALFDRKIISKPRLCKPCFNMVIKIPHNLSRIQTLLGGKGINTNLYTPGQEIQNDMQPVRVSSLHTLSKDNKPRGSHPCKIDQGLGGNEVRVVETVMPSLSLKLSTSESYIRDDNHSMEIIREKTGNETTCRLEDKEFCQRANSHMSTARREGKQTLQQMKRKNSTDSFDKIVRNVESSEPFQSQKERKLMVTRSKSRRVSKKASVTELFQDDFSVRETEEHSEDENMSRAQDDHPCSEELLVSNTGNENEGLPSKETEMNGHIKILRDSTTCRRKVLNSHLKRQKGVSFTCPVKGCRRKFSLRSSLQRHDQLVHHCADYKRRRAVVRYPCLERNCQKEFNRKALLKAHLRLSHGVTPSNEPHAETVCFDCGMVIDTKVLPSHMRLYHRAENYDQSNSATFLCGFKDCEEKFSSLEDRRLHVATHKDKPDYRCEVEECGQTFYLSKNLDNHLWGHCKQPSACDVDGCNMAFGDQLLLANHSKVHFNGQMRCCWRNCGMLFTSQGTLKQHLIAHSRSLKAHFGSDFVCTLCDRVFTSKHGLSKHMSLHDEQITDPTAEMNFRCEETGCFHGFSSEREFNNHTLGHLATIRTVCGVPGCSKEFVSLLALVKHSKAHHGSKYMCPWGECRTLFTNFYFVKRHLIHHLLSQPEVALQRPHRCQKCGLAFKTESNLHSHLKSHTMTSKCVCPDCGKEFQKSHLKRHMLIHSEDKAHVCNHCGKSYSTVNGLKFHTMKDHNIGQWPYTCDVCSRGFISRSELRRHMPSHTKEKPFSCDVCGATFAFQTGLVGHLRKHTGQKFPCDVSGCDKVFSTPTSLRGHRLQHRGFSKTCEHCEKVFTNPYSHKCKALREAAKKRRKASKGADLSSPESSSVTIGKVTNTDSTTFHMLTPVPHPTPSAETRQNLPPPALASHRVPPWGQCPQLVSLAPPAQLSQLSTPLQAFHRSRAPQSQNGHAENQALPQTHFEQHIQDYLEKKAFLHPSHNQNFQTYKKENNALPLPVLGQSSLRNAHGVFFQQDQYHNPTPQSHQFQLSTQHHEVPQQASFQVHHTQGLPLQNHPTLTRLTHPSEVQNLSPVKQHVPHVHVASGSVVIPTPNLVFTHPLPTMPQAVLYHGPYAQHQQVHPPQSTSNSHVYNVASGKSTI